MAWNIDYEHDSEEVILLKRRIAEQGSQHLIHPEHQSPQLAFRRFSR
jgi:hypothetical protein